MRTFLLISPYFAPQAAVGAYRWVKLARYLPSNGWRPVVLSATFPGDKRDESLLGALPPDVEVAEEYLDPRILAARARLASWTRRAARPEPAPEKPIEGLRPFHSLVDRCLPHALHAARSAVALARSSGAEAVVVSAGPFSACAVGLYVKSALGLPLVLDFRDPWGLHESGEGPPADTAERLRRAFVTAAERRLLARADHVILNTRRALDAYRARYPEIAPRSSFIRNHFDLDLYAPSDPGASRAASRGRFEIVHLGTLRAETTVDDIGEALRRLIARERLTPDDIVLRQVGRMTDFERRQLDAMGLSPFVEAFPGVEQRDVLAELRHAHLLLTMVSPRVKLRIAAKTYDYIASGMPIVSIAANPEVDELLVHRPDNARIEPGDVEGLTAVIARHFARFRETGAPPEPTPPPDEFSSPVAASRVAAILDRIAPAR